MSLIDRVVQAPLGDDPPQSRLLYGQDVRESLRLLPDACVQTVATSPPYWGLRDYGGEPGVWEGDPDCDHDWGPLGLPHHPGQVEQTKWKGAEAAGSGQFCTRCGAWLGLLGLEPTPEMFIEHLVEIFRGVKRVLHPTGTFWLNLGDSYNAAQAPGFRSLGAGPGLKPKDLVGIPWRAALALQADGWYLRSDIIWSKPNPMPESVSDRPTKSHEYIFLFGHPDNGGRYFYDAAAIKEQSKTHWNSHKGFGGEDKKSKGDPLLRTQGAGSFHPDIVQRGRNKRSVWRVNTKPYKGAHFATWPEALVEPMVMAGSSEYGCCSNCRAPYEREHIRSNVEGKPHVSTGGDPSRQDGGVRTKDPSGHGGNILACHTWATDSWLPTCDCKDARVVQCTVLDPFSGSATTGAVAMRLGRSYIGIDLQPDYIDLAEARLQGRPAPSKKAVVEEPDLIGELFGGSE